MNGRPWGIREPAGLEPGTVVESREGAVYTLDRRGQTNAAGWHTREGGFVFYTALEQRYRLAGAQEPARPQAITDPAALKPGQVIVAASGAAAAVLAERQYGAWVTVGGYLILDAALKANYRLAHEVGQPQELDSIVEQAESEGIRVYLGMADDIRNVLEASFDDAETQSSRERLEAAVAPPEPEVCGHPSKLWWGPAAMHHEHSDKCRERCQPEFRCVLPKGHHEPERRLGGGYIDCSCEKSGPDPIHAGDAHRPPEDVWG